MNNEKLKHTKVLDLSSPLTNMGSNVKELHTPTLIVKKSKRHNGDKKKKL
jgi:hypothetical protein